MSLDLLYLRAELGHALVMERRADAVTLHFWLVVCLFHIFYIGVEMTLIGVIM